MKAFFDDFHKELASDDFLAEYHLLCTLMPGVPRIFHKLDVPIGKLQQVSRSSGEEWHIQFLKHLMEEAAYEPMKEDAEAVRFAMLDGKIALTNGDLSVVLGRWSEEHQNWDKKPTMTSLGKKLSFMNIQHTGVACSGNVWDPRYKGPGGRQGNSVRCWWIDLGLLRAALRIDVAPIRRMIRNREEFDAAQTVRFDFQRALAESERAPMNAHVSSSSDEAKRAKIEVLTKQIDELQAEYQSLCGQSAPAVEETPDDDFDPEAFYNSVMEGNMPTSPPTTLPAPPQSEESEPPAESMQAAVDDAEMAEMAEETQAPTRCTEPFPFVLQCMPRQEDVEEDPRVRKARELMNPQRAVTEVTEVTENAKEDVMESSAKRPRLDVFREWQKARHQGESSS